MGQRVSIRRKGLGTIKDLEKTYLTEYQLYQEEYRKAISEGKKGDDARSAALDALKAKVQSLIPYIAGLRAIANEGSTTGLMRTVDALSEALTLAKSLGSFKMQEVTFINDEQAKRFAEAVKQAEFLQVWMRQAPAMRADLVQENWIAQFKQLKTLGKDQLKQIPEAFHGMTQEMADDLKSWVNVSNQIIGVFSNSIRSGFEAAFRDDGGAGEFFKSILLGAIDLTQGLIMAATAAAAAKQVLTWGFSSFADIPLLAAATIGLQGLRAYIATAFAEGGVVDRPTLALVGERGEMEIITPQRKLEKFLREQLLPEVMRSENFVAMARQTSPAFAGGSLDGLRKDIRDLHGTLKQKNFSASFPGLVTIDEAFARTAPRVARRKARERK
jgi:hypothetical protein